MRTLRSAAVFILLNALVSVPYALAVDQTGQDFPKSFTCKPVEFYSGGFDFYQVKKAEHSGEPQFVDFDTGRRRLRMALRRANQFLGKLWR